MTPSGGVGTTNQKGDNPILSTIVNGPCVLLASGAHAEAESDAQGFDAPQAPDAAEAPGELRVGLGVLDAAEQQAEPPDVVGAPVEPEVRASPLEEPDGLGGVPQVPDAAAASDAARVALAARVVLAVPDGLQVAAQEQPVEPVVEPQALLVDAPAVLVAAALEEPGGLALVLVEPEVAVVAGLAALAAGARRALPPDELAARDAFPAVAASAGVSRPHRAPPDDSRGHLDEPVGPGPAAAREPVEQRADAAPAHDSWL